MLIHKFMRVFFHLLYHPFAFTYDLVAWAVSFGKWREWITTILPFIEGTFILELGHGPGHLQTALCNKGLFNIGLDESAQMGRIAKRRLGGSARLVRGVAQHLPFRRGAFRTIVSTFPSDYIFDPHSLSEILRCLSDGARLIVLPAAWPKSTILRWIYRLTGEIPSDLTESIIKRFELPFINAGLLTTVEIIEVKSSILPIIIAKKRGLSC